MVAKCSFDGRNAIDKAKERHLAYSICIFRTESPNAEEVFKAQEAKKWGYFPSVRSIGMCLLLLSKGLILAVVLDLFSRKVVE